MHITLTTLKKGAEGLGIDFPQNITKKDLELKIEEKLSQEELGYECPSCQKDIPDVDICPYCSESFVDEEVTQNEEATATTENTDSTNAETTDEANEVVVEDQTDNTEVETEVISEEAPVMEQQPKDKVEPKKNRQTRKENATKEYEELIAAINEIAGPDVEVRHNNSGPTYLIDKKRIMKVTSTSKSISIEFNEELTTDDDNIKKFTAEEAKAKHLGTVRAIYSLGEVSIAVQLVKEAFAIRKGETVEV